MQIIVIFPLASEEKNQERITHILQEQENARQRSYEITAQKTIAYWEKADAPNSHPYLNRKHIKPYGTRVSNNALILPLRDIEGKLWSLQTIDTVGKKRFLAGGKKKGCFFLIGSLENASTINICEGYATGASIYEATGLTTAVAFDAGNIEPVTTSICKAYPDITIILCGDNDQWKEYNTGKETVEIVAEKYSCKAVLPEFPDSLKDNKPTDFNDLHVLVGLEEVKRQLDAANNAEVVTAQAYSLPECFKVNKSGVYYIDPDPDKQSLKLCSKLEITSFTHDEDDNNHGRLLEWESERTRKHHQWAMPCRMLAGDGIEIREKLLDEGLILTPGRKARERLLEYIQSVKPKHEALSLSRIGWHGDSFALPDIVYPETKSMVLQSEGGAFESFRTAGTLEEWQKHVARYASGNSRLILSLAIAFAAPLLKVATEESGAIHFVGHSSKGKTSALRIAGSVWGGGGENGFIKQWRSTGNAQEAIAEQHRDCLLPLDELGQADSKTVGETVYMLANNQGKSRMKSSAALKRTYEWRVLVISSGEVTLESKMLEAGKKAHAGMEVRFINIPAEVEGAHGLFEDLHGFASGHEFSLNLKDGCSKYYGTAIRVFLEGIAGKASTLIDSIRDVQEDFNTINVKNEVSGQVKRVARRFGLIAAAGELAIAMGILPLQEGDALTASGQCFHDWLDSRGSTDNLETDKGIAQIRAYLERYGTSKFITLDEYGKESSQSRPIERIGYRQLQRGVYHYYVLPEAYKSELCKGFNPRLITSALADKGYLIKGPDGKNQVNKTFPGESKQRVYQIGPSIFEGEEKS